MIGSRILRALGAALAAIVLALTLPAAPAAAVTAPAPAPPVTAPANPTAPGKAAPQGPAGPRGTAPGNGSLNIDVTGKPSQTIMIIMMLTIMSVAPALLILMTSFTKIVVVLSLTRNALGLQGVPPNQVLVGLALFLSLFVMAPTLTKVNSEGLQPYLANTKTQQVAFEDGLAPLREFMLKNTRKSELGVMVKASGTTPAKSSDVAMSALIPAFILSELKAAFIIGFVIFVPMLVIDLVVSSALMSMGMMMMPPVMVSLPFKLLLFVMVDGWALVVTSLIESYR